MISYDQLEQINDIYENNNMSIIKLASLPVYDEPVYDFNDPKNYNQYIKDLERIIRQSFEYRQFIAYLRNIEGMNKCSFLDNVESKADTKVKIEIHHSPFTLYDICVTVFRKRSSNNESLNINDVAEEIMYLHYIGWVGLIPLSSTVHDMVHSGYIFIPIDKIRGNYRFFIESYYNYINPELLDSIDSLEHATSENLLQNRLEIFNNHRLYVDINGSYNLSNKDDLKNSLRERISEIKDNKPKLKEMCKIIK